MLRVRGGIEGVGGGKVIKDVLRLSWSSGWAGGFGRWGTYIRVFAIDGIMLKYKMYVLVFKLNVREIF